MPHNVPAVLLTDENRHEQSATRDSPRSNRCSCDTDGQTGFARHVSKHPRLAWTPRAILRRGTLFEPAERAAEVGMIVEARRDRDASDGLVRFE